MNTNRVNKIPNAENRS